tara:strand:+ start:257 stop:460 length:204 start_codon:yes stop_codon:yes gene_type:complete
MALCAPFNMRKINSNDTQRRYARNYIGFARRLISTGIEKKTFFDHLGEKISDVLGVDRSRKKRVFVN